ncbi:DsbA family protein [Pseudobdellovibrio sp. HCB154]|uniref:DsbA family protein n=1 Tax=Pseudobdellovibrio sp. HCB154 TaxID=3386277 RepID=UPI003917201F
MNQLSGLLKISIIGLLLASCAPSAKQIKEAVEKDPSIVFTAIEKAPDQFIEVVMKAQQSAQKVAGERAQQEEQKQREEEFKNPLKPEVEEGRVIFGNKSAPITIVEYSDFQCPYCSRGYTTMKELKKQYGDKVRFVFKHLPLDFHPLAIPAARYFEAIAMQDHAKAEKFHDLVFENQGQMQSKGEGLFKELAKKAGADIKKLEASLKDEKISKRIEADTEEARKFNMSGTPGYLINGISLRGAYPLAAFKEIIDRQLSAKN